MPAPVEHEGGTNQINTECPMPTKLDASLEGSKNIAFLGFRVSRTRVAACGVGRLETRLELFTSSKEGFSGRQPANDLHLLEMYSIQ